MSRSTGSRPRAVPAEGLPPSVTAANLLTDGSDRLFRELIQNLLAMGTLLHRLRHRLAADIGMSRPQYAVFLAVAHLQGESGVGPGAVAQHLRVTPALVTSESGALERGGLIAKRVNPADRRSVLLSLTEAGRTALLDFAPALQRVNDAVFGGLSPNEFHGLLETVRSVVEAAERTELLEQARATGAKRDIGTNEKMENGR